MKSYIVVVALIVAGCNYQQPKDVSKKYNVLSTVDAGQQEAIPALHKLTTNPTYDMKHAETEVRGYLKLSKIDAIKLEKLAFNKVALESDITNPGITLDSEVWKVSVDGDMKWPFGHGSLKNSEDEKLFSGKRIEMLLSSENGSVLTAKLLH